MIDWKSTGTVEVTGVVESIETNGAVKAVKVNGSVWRMVTTGRPIHTISHLREVVNNLSVSSSRKWETVHVPHKLSMEES